jgi:uncharacterized protein
MRKILLIITLLVAIKATAQTYRQAIIAHQQAYKDDFLKNSHSPLKEADLSYVRFFEPDSTFRVSGVFTQSQDKTVFTIPTSDGKQKEYFNYGIIKFKLKGQTLQLNVYRSLSLMRTPQYKNYLFIPFKDATNAQETYGGGRYLDLETSDIQADTVILDFNKAYNPYCAFSNGYSCPIPPRENHLNVRIEVGEKVFLKEH